MNAVGIVYVVDDDDSFRTALTRMLTAAGIGVQSFARGEELLTYVRGTGASRGTACVLADLRMPGLDGLEKNKAIVIPGAVNKVLGNLSAITPHAITRRLGAAVLKRAGH
jgi:FixJ family two-component response regulator